MDYGFLWDKETAAKKEEEKKRRGEVEEHEGLHGSSPILCGRCSHDSWLLAQLCQQKGDTERNRQGLAQEFLAGGYPRIVVRSDGEPALKAHIRAAVAIAMVNDRPLEVVTETVSKEQSSGNGLAEGAVKEAKAKIRTLRAASERGLGRTIPEDHDALAWLVEFAAKTVNWFRTGVDGKTPSEKRFGRRFRRPIAPFGQKVLYMPTGKIASRVGADSRWREGCFLGLIGGGSGANDYAIGTPDGVVSGRAIKLLPAGSAWDPELLLSVKGLPWDRTRRQAAPRVFLPVDGPVVAEAVIPPPPEPSEPAPRRVYIREKVEIAKYGMTAGCPGCMAIAEGATAQGHSEECRSRIEKAMKEDAVGEGARRLEMAEKRRKLASGEGQAAGPQPVQEGGSSSSTAVAVAVPSPPQGARRQLEGGDTSASSRRRLLQDRSGDRRGRDGASAAVEDQPPLSRPRLSADDTNALATPLVQLGSLQVYSVDLAELFCPGRFAEVASAFHLIPGTAFDLRIGWDLCTAHGRQECWQQLHREMPLVVIGSPPCSSFSVLQALNKDTDKRRAAMKEGLRFVQFCCSVYRWQLDRGAGFLHEHPWAASSFQLPCIQDLRRRTEVQLVRCDQCAFGQAAWHQGPSGWEWRLARKRTGFLTNIPEIASTLNRKCDGSHEHASLFGGTARPTERYPPKLVAAILKALVKYARRLTGSTVNSLEAGVGPHVDEDPPEADLGDVGGDVDAGSGYEQTFYD